MIPKGLGDLVAIYDGSKPGSFRDTTLNAILQSIRDWAAREKLCNCLLGPYPDHETGCTSQAIGETASQINRALTALAASRADCGTCGRCGANMEPKAIGALGLVVSCPNKTCPDYGGDTLPGPKAGAALRFTMDDVEDMAYFFMHTQLERSFSKKIMVDVLCQINGLSDKHPAAQADVEAWLKKTTEKWSKRDGER